MPLQSYTFAPFRSKLTKCHTRSTTTMLNTHYAYSVELDTSRESVAGVDLNDEATNMIQYQRSYSAACRLMTTLDETLDKLINGTGVVGR